MSSNLVALLVALALFSAFYGWGRLTQSALTRCSGDRLSGFAAAIGLASVLALCGLSNLLKLPSQWVLLGLTLIGLAAAARYALTGLRQSGWRTPLREALPPLVLILIGLPLLLDGLTLTTINPHDDAYSYLLAPIQIQQLGYYRPDPFNYRMMVGNIGGLSYLQSGLVSFMEAVRTPMLDRTVGLLIFVETVTQLVRRLRLWRWSLLLVSPLFLLHFFFMVVNVSATYLLLAMTLALYGLLADDGVTRPGAIAAAALVAAGMVAMKTLGGVFAAPLIAGFLLLAVARGRLTLPRMIGNALLLLTVATAALMPWLGPWLLTDSSLIALTWGSGTDQINLSMLLDQAHLRGLQRRYLLVLGLAALTYWMVRDRRLDILALTLGGFAGAGAVAVLTGGVALGRYDSVVLLVVAVVLGLLLISRAPTGLSRSLVALLMLFIFVQFQPTSRGLANAAATVGEWPSDYARQVSRLGVSPNSAAPWAHQLSKAQASIPAGARTLVWMGKPYQLDFTRNPIHVLDFPCTASAPERMPCHTDGFTLARWLLANHVRYLIYSHRDQAGFSVEMVRRRLSLARFTPWQRAMNQLVPVFHQRVAEMALHCRPAYLGPVLVVFDLSQCVAKALPDPRQRMP